MAFRTLSARTALGASLLLSLAFAGCGDDPIGPRTPEDVEFDPALGIVLEDMTILPSGVYIETLVAGSGDPVTTGRVEVDYTLWIPDGTQIDSSRAPGRTPLPLTFGAGDVIPGFELGVSGMRVGELRRILVPSELGYGDRANGQIPAQSVLVFEVELISAEDAAAA